MVDDVEELIITPFLEVIELGNITITNAGNNQLMSQAAQQLVKDAQRAVDKIMRISDRRIKKYGLEFVHAVKDNDKIAQNYTDLMDLLWDFEDYTSVKAFHVERLTTLRAEMREKAYQMCLELVRVKIGDSSSFASPASRPSFTRRQRYEAADFGHFLERYSHEFVNVEMQAEEDAPNHDENRVSESSAYSITMESLAEQLRALSGIDTPYDEDPPDLSRKGQTYG